VAGSLRGRCRHLQVQGVVSRSGTSSLGWRHCLRDGRVASRSRASSPGPGRRPWHRGVAVSEAAGLSRSRGRHLEVRGFFLNAAALSSRPLGRPEVGVVFETDPSSRDQGRHPQAHGADEHACELRLSSLKLAGVARQPVACVEVDAEECITKIAIHIKTCMTHTHTHTYLIEFHPQLLVAVIVTLQKALEFGCV
jgi:hypothetical protein